MLKEITTRELLAWRDKCYKMGGMYSPDYGCCEYPMFYSLDQIKEELARREHIPNKKEAKKMSLEKWNEKAEITEEEFVRLIKQDDVRRIDKELGLNSADCGFCEYYYEDADCGDCPLNDNDEDITCCKEWSAADHAVCNGDYAAYHAAACALRDRIAGMEYEREADEDRVE